MIRVMIAEDQRMLRGAIATLLSLEEDIEIIGEAGTGEEALQLIKQVKPDICVMDIEMPVLSGLDVAEAIKDNSLSCRVVILTTFARPGYFERALKAGVHGYLLKDSPIDELADSIRRIHQGQKVISPELSFSFWQDRNPLTDREQEVLGLVAEGLTAQEITKKLYISNGTVRNYMSEILAKLEAKNRIEAISIAQEKGWIKK